MTAIVMLTAAMCTVHPCPKPPAHLTPIGSGLATFYADGVFGQVIRNRDLAVPPGVIGFAAMLTPERIGSLVWIRWPDGSTDGPYLVADCATAGHRAALIERGWIIDVDHGTAVLHGMRGPVTVEIFDRVAPCK